MSIRNSVGTINNTINEVSLVNNLREQIYARKIEIIKTPYVKEIINSIFTNPNMPPKLIQVCNNGIIVRNFDSTTHTYHPIGETVFCPTDASFDYEFCCALNLIIQDIYPNIYKMSTATTQEIVEALQQGYWNISLTMQDKYFYNSVTPTFDINNIDNLSLDQLPIQINDPKSRKFKYFAPISIILSLISVILSGSFLGSFFPIIAFILSMISIKTQKNKGLSIIAVIFSSIAILLPFVFMFIKLNNFFN